MFEEAGFYGVEILNYHNNPWQVIDGIEFRSLTVRAYKGKEEPCLERKQAVIYKGPWRKVVDDDGHTFHRGQRMAVCDKTFNIMTHPEGPYGDQIIPILPQEDIPLDSALLFDCRRHTQRHPHEMKGLEYRETRRDSAALCDCGPGGC